MRAEKYARPVRMKIRILNDSERLRLERDEVDAIRLGKPVEASTHFVDAQVFRYCPRVGM
jgi:hypothetical protein